MDIYKLPKIFWVKTNDKINFGLNWRLYSNFSGITGQDECDFGSPYEKCFHLIPRDKLREIKIVPDEDQLKEICP